MHPAARHLPKLAGAALAGLGRMGMRTAQGLPDSRTPHHEEAPP